MEEKSDSKQKEKNMNDNISQNIIKNITDRSPGAILIVSKGGKILFEKFAGISNLNTGEKINPSTSFRLASLTKQFTAMAIMILKEKKLLDYEDTLEKFFPDFPKFGNTITIRQLLTHTSGIPDHEKPLYKKIKPGEEPTIYDAFEVLKNQKKLMFLPEDKYLYSDAGYVLLALIIEHVSGEKYSKFLAKSIFDPLKMTNTIVVDETKPEIKNRAIGYKIENNNWIEHDYDPLNYIVGDEGIYSTTRDLLRWSKAWTKNILVSKKTLAEGLTPVILNDGSPGNSSISWVLQKQNGKNIIYQTGTWVGFSNIMLIDPNTKTTILLLSNICNFPSGIQRINFALQLINLL